jgi:hypothetical protein
MRAVFGVVSRVVVLSPVNKVVYAATWFDYFTVYQNLSSVSVNPGDR